MDSEIEIGLQKIIKQLSEQFGNELDLKGILFLIGVQELGKMRQKYSKNEKLELMHIAVCTLLEEYGYYEFQGKDEDGWPHWKSTEKLPSLKPMEQERLIKQAIVLYFEKNRTFEN
ncbi:MAG TPA: hypothetical protein VFL70_02055 [Bacteroidia bacterium]|jgi:hypothetical protein|nr:hypothetical protein [Bacteroidia bacterium]HNO71256.1 hypothetical protein [Bacteroidia bacterium]